MHETLPDTLFPAFNASVGCGARFLAGGARPGLRVRHLALGVVRGGAAERLRRGRQLAEAGPGDVVPPSPATHAILTRWKAGEIVFQTFSRTETVLQLPCTYREVT